MKKKQLISSDKTTYVLTLKEIKSNLYTVKLNYNINGKELRKPIVYYRITKEAVAERYYNQIAEIVQDNLDSLCVDKMKNWLWSRHIVQFLFDSKN